MNKVELAEAFNSLFAGLTLAHGKMRPRDTYKNTGKQEADYNNVKEAVTVKTWEKHLDGDSIGIFPIKDDGTSVVFGAIDIDSYQNFSFDNLLRKIDSLGFPLVVCRSKSGSAHCYLFASEPISAEIFHLTLREWAAALGHATNDKGEPTEIFPKQIKILIEKGDVGSFINMPYDGLENTKRFALKLVNNQIQELGAEEFIEYANEKKVSLVGLNGVHIPKCKEFSNGPPCLEMLAELGVEEGGRNTTLFNMGVYARLSFPDKWEDIIEEYNRKFLSTPLSSKEVTNTIKAVNRKEYTYTCKQSPLSNYCLKAECISRKFGVGSDIGETPTLDTILKINTDPPTYILNMLDRQGKPVPISLSAEELLSARKTKTKCLQALNFLPYIPKQPDWEKQVQKVMERITVIEVPDDSSSSGQLMHHLHQYLSKKARNSQRTEILNGKPFFEENKVYFRMVDFCAYLEQNHFRSFKPNEICIIFRYHEERSQMGHRSFNVNGKCVQTWWVFKDQITNVELSVPAEMRQDDIY